MPARTDHRDKVVAAAAELLRSQGRSAVTTRAVSTAAGVQPPTIYRLFGDMTGLLDAVAADGFARYIERKKAQEPSEDPVDDLRQGWDLHVEFGLANPAHYLLMYGEPAQGEPNAAGARAQGILLSIVERAARAGRLVIGVEQAADMFHAAGMGVTLSLIGTAPEQRDLSLSVRTREAVIAAATGDAPAGGSEPARCAVALRSALDESGAEFSRGERLLFEELLTRVAGSGA